LHAVKATRMQQIIGATTLASVILSGCTGTDSTGTATTACNGLAGSSEGQTYCPTDYEYHIVKDIFSTTIAYCIKATSTYAETEANTAIDVPNVDSKSTLLSGTAGRCGWCATGRVSSPDGNGACWTPYFDAEDECPESFPFASGENNAWCSKSGYEGTVNEVYYRGMLSGYWHCCRESYWSSETSFCAAAYLCEQGTASGNGTFTETYQMTMPCGTAPCATYRMI